MELQLRSLIDDSVYRLCRRRYLIGNGPRADIPLGAAGAAFRAGLLVRYRAGWVLHGLRARPPLFHNGRRVRDRCDLAAGDRLRHAGQVLVAEAVAGRAMYGQPTEGEELEALAVSVWLDRPRCRLTVRASDAAATEYEADADTVIGTSSRCDLTLPKRLGLATHHCLLAAEAGRWYLHDVSGCGIRRGGRRRRSLAVHDGDEIYLGAVHVAFRFDKPRPVDTATVRAEETDTVVPGEWSGVLPASPSRGDDLCTAASRLCRWLYQAHQGERSPVSAGQELRLALKALQVRLVGSRAGEPRRALQFLEEGLRRDPWNFNLLRALAQFFERVGDLDHCLLTLRLTQRLYPKDVEINRALAELYHHRKDFARSLRYWNLVLQARPHDAEVAQIIRDVSAERAMAEWPSGAQLKAGGPNG